jgi:hypothetical protein
LDIYKRSVAVVVVTELKIKVLSNGTYCLEMSLITSWAAHPPVFTEEEIIKTNDETKQIKNMSEADFNRHRNMEALGHQIMRLFAWAEIGMEDCSPINAATACNSAAP